MSFKSFEKYSEKADEHRSCAEFVDAGDYYTLAGYEALGAGEVTVAPFERGEVNAARGLCSFLEATVCYRTADDSKRAQNRAKQGILVCQDVQNNAVKYEPQRALMDEYVGDFRLVGGLDGFDDEYETAEKTYTTTENHIGWQADPAFELNMTFFLTLAGATEHGINSTQKVSITTESLTERIKYKRNNFPEIMEKVVRDSCWTN